LTALKRSQKIGLHLQFSNKLPKVNNRSIGENLTNLVTLTVSDSAANSDKEGQ
jgi:hypothetical protein